MRVPPPLTPAAWLLVAWLAVVNTALAFTLWTHTQRTLTAARVERRQHRNDRTDPAARFCLPGRAARPRPDRCARTRPRRHPGRAADSHRVADPVERRNRQKRSLGSPLYRGPTSGSSGQATPARSAACASAVFTRQRPMPKSCPSARWRPAAASSRGVSPPAGRSRSPPQLSSC